ncbi:MAG: diguanylate cyclase [Deltaproteobacteria bacterium]|nr:diguanylate cyclase [Deltaproteobacteria bacterium]
MSETVAELAGLKAENECLKMRLVETREQAAVREKVLKAGIAELERLYLNLEKKMAEVREKGYEIKMLNALNEIIATASRYLELDLILQPTLDMVVEATERLLHARDKDVSVSGGIFLVEDNGLVLAALRGIRPELLGCGGKVEAGTCICGAALASRETVYTPFCLTDPRHTFMHPGGLQDHAHVAIPLNSGNEIVGVLFLYFTPAGYEPEPADNAIFESFGGFIGVHIGKARLYATVKDLAIHDGLTGLYTRVNFEEFLTLELGRAKRHERTFALLMMDIDSFKRLNDTYGHQFGDSVLKAVSRLITKNLRNFDVAGRYGGEEFCVLAPEAGADGGTAAAERLRALVEAESFIVQGAVAAHSGVTISIGVAAYPLDGQTAAELIRAADSALYEAKRAGRNMVCRYTGVKPTAV